MNEINVGEVYYILFRKRGPEKADYFIETILASLPILTVSNGFDDVINAAKIKAEHPLSFADCLTVDTARKYNAIIMTGDPEFKKIEQLVEIEWLD
jgi:ribonuclease VapC